MLSNTSILSFFYSFASNIIYGSADSTNLVLFYQRIGYMRIELLRWSVGPSVPVEVAFHSAIYPYVSHKQFFPFSKILLKTDF